MEFTGEVAFKPHCAPYSQTSLRVALELADVENPQNVRTIQTRTSPLQMARKYVADENAEFILVTNNTTDRTQVATWNQLAEDLGTQVNLWNVSLYGTMSVTEAIRGVRLKGDCAGKTLVLLNQAFDTKDNGKQVPSKLWGQAELLDAAATQGMSVYVIGNTGDVVSQLTPAQNFAAGQPHHSIHTFESALEENQVGIANELGIDATQRAAVSLESCDVGAQFILGANNRYAMCKALPFAKKVAALQAALGAPKGTMLKPLVQAICDDLREEQLALRQGAHTRHALTPEVLPQRMPRLEALSNFQPEAAGLAHPDNGHAQHCGLR